MQLLSIVPKPGETLVSGCIAQTFTDVDLRTVPALTLWRSVSGLQLKSWGIWLGFKVEVRVRAQCPCWLSSSARAQSTSIGALSMG